MSRLFIGGTWVAPSSDATFDVVSPHTGEPLATVAAPTTSVLSAVSCSPALSAVARTASGRPAVCSCGRNSVRSTTDSPGGSSSAAAVTGSPAN